MILSRLPIISKTIKYGVHIFLRQDINWKIAWFQEHITWDFLKIDRYSVNYQLLEKKYLDQFDNNIRVRRKYKKKDRKWMIGK